jgi:hypothetical protein
MANRTLTPTNSPVRGNTPERRSGVDFATPWTSLPVAQQGGGAKVLNTSIASIRPPAAIAAAHVSFSEPPIAVVSAAAAHQRSILPLPASLDTSCLVVADDGSMVVDAVGRQAAAASSTSFMHDTFSSSHLRRAASSPNRSSRNKSQPHGHNKSSTHNSILLPPGGGFLDRSIHTADAQCCHYKKQEAHSQVKGLYVTFCQHSADEIVANAQRELEYERDLRAHDKHFSEVELLKVVKRLKEAEAARDAAVMERDQLRALREKESSEHQIIRNEFERRWEATKADLTAALEQLSAAKKQAEASHIQMNNGIHHAQELERALNEARVSLTRIEKESTENAQRALLYFEEKRAVQIALDQCKTELTRTKDILSTKELLIKGLDKELLHAHEKLSTVDVLRKAVKNSMSTAGSMSPTKAADASSRGHSRVRDRIGLR